jgi:hypothetical protein
MEYVMVPVPEEHVAEVEKFLQLNTMKTASKVLDHDTAARLLGGLEEHARAFLLQAAEAADERVAFTVGDAAEAAGCTEREVLGLTVELNNAFSDAGGPQLTVVPMLHGARQLIMARDVAELFLAAAGRENDTQM